LPHTFATQSMDCRWLSARTLDVSKFQSCARGKRLKPCSAHLSPATGLARHLLLLVVVVVVPQHQVAGCPASLAGAPRARLQHHHVLACAAPRCSAVISPYTAHTSESDSKQTWYSGICLQLYTRVLAEDLVARAHFGHAHPPSPSCTQSTTQICPLR